MIPVLTAYLTDMHCLTEACNGLQVLQIGIIFVILGCKMKIN